MRVLWLITARSGSKGVPHKNIRPLGGRPLLTWRIDAVKPLLTADSALWLSTDNEEYATIGRNYGAEIPFLRPKELSGQTATSESVCLHAVEHAQHMGRSFDYLCLLQPTSPFVTTESLQRGLAALQENPAAHAAIAVCHAPVPSLLLQPHTKYLHTLAERLSAMASSRRQSLPQEITPCGGFYIARWEKFIETPRFFTPTSLPVLVDELEALDIDTPFDFLLAESMAQILPTLRASLACSTEN